jgi:hypothetical protein
MATRQSMLAESDRSWARSLLLSSAAVVEPFVICLVVSVYACLPIHQASVVSGLP